MMNYSEYPPKEDIIKEEVIFTGKYFKTILYYLKNGNKVKYTDPNWKQTDYGTEIKETQEEKIEKQAYKMRHRRW